MIYLKLSVAGHFMIFVVRTEGPFWRARPANILLGAVIGTQIIATLIVVYGVFMAPIGWVLAGAVWGYAIIADLGVTDFLKVHLYRLLDTTGIRFRL